MALEYFGKAASKGYQLAAEKLNRPLADGTRRSSKKKTKNKNQNYLTVVVSDPKVKQDDDDDDDDDDNDNSVNNYHYNKKNYTRDICTIQ